MFSKFVVREDLMHTCGIISSYGEAFNKKEELITILHYERAVILLRWNNYKSSHRVGLEGGAPK